MTVGVTPLDTDFKAVTRSQKSTGKGTAVLLHANNVTLPEPEQ